jgi:hypothetical protein
VSGEKIACVDDFDNCDNIILVEDESAGEKRMGRGKQIGPSGLDFILLGEELEDGFNNGLLEVGAGLNEVGSDRVVESDPGENQNPVLLSIEKQNIVDLNVLSTNEHVLHPCPVPLGDAVLVANPINLSCQSENISSSSGEIHGDFQKLQVLKKQGGRNKLPLGCGPKFLQLVEAVKEVGGGGRSRRGRGGEVGRSRSVPAKKGRSEVIGVPVKVVDVAIPPSVTNGVANTSERNFDLEGLNLEVVLPGHILSHPHDLGSQESEGCSVVPETPLCKGDSEGLLIKEARTIMGIQKKVGFSFPINEVQYVKKLIEEEIKDQEKLKAREQQTDDQ